MTQEVKVVAYEGGSLRLLPGGGKGSEAVLALPLSRMLVQMSRVPAGEDPVAVTAPLLQASNPFPDEQLTVGCETVRESEQGSVVIAAALPEGAADDIGEALDAAKLNVTRVDILELGQLRSSWNAICGADGDSRRRVVLVASVDGTAIIVLDGDQPAAMRSSSAGSDLRREVMQTLLEAEGFGGEKPLAEIVVLEPERPEGAGAPENPENPDNPEPQETHENPPDFGALAAFAPVRRVSVGADSALLGVAERSLDPQALNALPASWAEVLDETRFKSKLVKYLSVAIGIWALAMGVLFGVPMVYDFMTDGQKAETKRHHAKFAEVKKMVDKVNLVRKYSDHDHSALELMKAVSDRLPEGVTLSDFDYRRDKGISVKGDAGSTSDVYDLKDAMEKMAFGEDEDAEKVFGAIKLDPVGSPKGGRVRFSMYLEFPEEGWQQ